jgi:hypothetical protein
MTIINKEEQTMKKSEAYHLAQIAVVQSPSISPENKLEILRILSVQEHFERYCEEEKVNETL